MTRVEPEREPLTVDEAIGPLRDYLATVRHRETKARRVAADALLRADALQGVGLEVEALIDELRAALAALEPEAD